MKKYLILIFISISLTLFSQEVENNQEEATESINSIATYTAINIANQFPDYPATPGDIYEIYFLTGANENQTLKGFVDLDYNIDLSFIGKVNVKGLIYSELQQLLKDKINAAYPGSIVNVAIKSTGKFRVTILGEVKQARIVTAMSLNTLSEIIAGKTTPYASFRDIEIKSEDGTTAVYDLFQFTRYADKKNNPYLKPNDIITIKPYERSVQITGAIKRPGTYQLLQDETLDDLINIQAEGFTKIAETSNIEIQRIMDNNNTYEEGTIYINSEEIELDSIILSDYDKITVKNKRDYAPRITIQGAITLPSDIGGEEVTKAGVSVSNSTSLPIIEGNRVSTIVNKAKSYFNITSDLENAFILRGSEKISLDIEQILADKDYTDEEVIDKDILVIPFKQLIVYVAGSVNESGAKPFIANRTAEYYIGLAGGPDREENIFGSYQIRDVYGNKRPKDSIIGPEDVIWVKRNHPMSYISEYAGWITTIFTGLVLIPEFLAYY